ncbi:MAG: ABC-ATPase domain-containing protein [Gammaproteobacteria bacterium]|nr:ABC-ATPase domain-containing protein [Gammaproteobacteria bacterium]
MNDYLQLKQKLHSLDKQDYVNYQSLLGDYDFPLFKLIIHQIPKDPYAPPHTGLCRIQVQRNDERFINLNLESKVQTVAFADFLARTFYISAQSHSDGIRGTGFSGLITINQPGQAILERNNIVITDDVIEVRCFIGFPGEGRLIKANIADDMLFKELPAIVEASLLKKNIDHKALQKHIEVAEDADTLRKKLDSLGLIAFIANDSILPRKSGLSDEPMSAQSIIPFIAPETLNIEIDLPHAGCINGLAIKKGVTLIVGGGYHGKSTLLSTIENGIYNHIPGDGREYCVTNNKTAKIRAYSGRRVVNTDISPFINNLPCSQNTSSFSTDNASGSTSQAVNIIEAMEANADVLLMDEDTCATNFMIRDNKMQQLVQKDDEPITTYIDKVTQLYLEKNISTILVLGGVGDYFDVSDQVIQMISYQPHDVTIKAHQIAENSPTKRAAESEAKPIQIHERIPLSSSILPINTYGKFSIYAKDIHRLVFGDNDTDLTDVEQLTELSQTKALGYAIEYAKKYMDGKTTLCEVVERVVNDVDERGLDILSQKLSGHFACFRALELAFAINRLGSLKVKQKELHD